MNITAIKFALKTFGARSIGFLKRYAPQILVTTGVAGFVGTAVVTGKATLKARDILDERDKKLQEIEDARDFDPSCYSIADYNNDKKIVKTQTSWKLIKTYFPPVTLGAASAALVFGGHHMMGRRAAAALASAYEAQKKLHSYRNHVAEQLGSEVEQKLADGLAIDRLEVSDKLKKLEEEKPVTAEKDPTDVSDQFVWLFCEESNGSRIHGSGCWQPSAYANWVTVVQKQNEANEMLKSRGSLTINDILVDLFQADPLDIGMEYGWVWDEKFGYDVIDFGLGELNTDSGLAQYLKKDEPNIWFHFNARKNPLKGKLQEIAERKHQLRKKYWR